MDWVNPKMDELSCGTIKSYICTYELFLTYVAMERIRPGQVPDLPTDVKLIFKATLPKLKGWRKTVDLDMKAERSEKRPKECDTRLTTEDINAFTRSKVMLDAGELLERARDGQSLTTLELCLIRDMLLAELTITTGTQPGALGNATMCHFKSSRCDLETAASDVSTTSQAQVGRPSTHHIPSRGPSAHGYLCGVRSSPVDRFKGRGAVRDIRRHAIYERHHLQPPSRNLEEVWGSPRPEGDRYEHS